MCSQGWEMQTSSLSYYIIASAPLIRTDTWLKLCISHQCTSLQQNATTFSQTILPHPIDSSPSPWVLPPTPSNYTAPLVSAYFLSPMGHHGFRDWSRMDGRVEFKLHRQPFFSDGAAIWIAFLWVEISHTARDMKDHMEQHFWSVSVCRTGRSFLRLEA